MKHKPRTITGSLFAGFSLFAITIAGAAPTLQGPYTHLNLEVYLVSDETPLEGMEILTLGQAMTQEAVIVHETGDVNELKIENTSTSYVYVHPGDIVKGGKQDRTLANCFLLPPGHPAVPVDSFCVEQGRWQKRGGEDLNKFSSSGKTLNSKNLKLANRYSKEQGEVWKKVAEEQDKLSEKAGNDVRDSGSASSLQLTLESADIEKARQGYEDAIGVAIPRDLSGVSGLAFAINGKFNSADIFGSSALFEKMWPKMLEAMATEAFAEYDAASAVTPLGESAVLAALAAPDSAEPEIEQLAAGNESRTRDAATHVSFEGRWLAAEAGASSLVYNNVLSKEDYTVSQAGPSGRGESQQVEIPTSRVNLYMSKRTSERAEGQRGFFGRLFGRD